MTTSSVNAAGEWARVGSNGRPPAAVRRLAGAIIDAGGRREGSCSSSAVGIALVCSLAHILSTRCEDCFWGLLWGAAEHIFFPGAVGGLLLGIALGIALVYSLAHILLWRSIPWPA